MKIIQFIYALEPGGAERFVVDLSNQIAEKNETVIFTLRDGTIGNNGFYLPEISNKVRYVNLKISEGFKPGLIWMFYKILKSEKPDIVHCHLNLVNYFFPLIFVFPKVKFFQTIHDDARREVNNILEYWVRRYFYKHFKMKAITISEENSNSFVAYYKTHPFKEIYNGRANPVPSSDFSDIKDEFQIFRDKKKTIFLHVGRCSVQKNQEMLVNVFNKLIQDGKQIVLLIIGPGFDSEEGHKLKSLANDNIFFLGEKHNISDYFLSADAFCLSSIHEGMPISLIEALASGCIPICTPVGGIINAIKNGETGYLSKSVSPDDYYLAVLSYLENKDQVIKEDLVQYYLTHFSIEECAKRYLMLYEN